MSASSLPGSNLKRAAESPSEARPPKQSRPDVSSSTEEVTEAEAALYDRQIRLWGLAAQNRYAFPSLHLFCSSFFVYGKLRI